MPEYLKKSKLESDKGGFWSKETMQKDALENLILLSDEALVQKKRTCFKSIVKVLLGTNPVRMAAFSQDFLVTFV